MAQPSFELAEDSCFHCLQPLPQHIDIRVNVAGHERRVCCFGCQAVAATIEAHQLTHFYQYRDTSNPAAVPLIPEELKAFEAYDNPQLQDSFVDVRSDESAKITLSIDGMTCSACAWLIENEVSRLIGIQRVQVNATTERVIVQWLPTQLKLSDILKAIAGIGYQALPFQPAQAEQEFREKRRQYVRRLGVAGIATMQVMMIAVGLYFGVVSDLDTTTKTFLWFVSLFFATPVILYSAQPFYSSALRSIQAGRPNMDVPVSMALLGAYTASAYATFTQQGDVYFESVSMFTLFLLTGRYVELLARQRAVSVAANLIKLLPAVAEREQHNGTHEQVLVSQLQVDDVIWVKPGATVPIDGCLLSANGATSESLLTGESRPVNKRQGDQVLAGSVNQYQPLQLKVSARPQQTVLASIINLQDQALGSKPKLARMADAIATTFVWRLLIVAALTFAIWMWIDPTKAFWITLAVLVATCPCALSLAAPTALTGAIYRLNRSGVLVRNADILEPIRTITTVVFDKTGTLTEGEFRLAASHWFVTEPEQAAYKSKVASLERLSEHPIAQPLCDLSSTEVGVEQFSNEVGSGVEGAFNDGQEIRIGSADYIKQWHPALTTVANANVYVASREALIAAFVIEDSLKTGAEELIQQLQRNYSVILLSGDNQTRAEALAKQLSIEKVYSEHNPEQKLGFIKSLQAQGQHVLMVGDGINDGPVLAQADISVSFSHAADLAKSGADIVLLNRGMQGIQTLLKQGQRCHRIMKQNVAWALVYNIGILPIAMAGFVTPYIAAIGMSVSSLLVLFNSLRLYR